MFTINEKLLTKPIKPHTITLRCGSGDSVAVFIQPWQFILLY